MTTSRLRLLSTSASLDELFARSRTRPQLIFKHSLICPTSTWAKHALDNHLATGGHPEVDYWLIEIQRSRPVSNQVATRTRVRHESPQALLLTDSRVVAHASHGALTEDWFQSLTGHMPPADDAVC